MFSTEDNWYAELLKEAVLDGANQLHMPIWFRQIMRHGFFQVNREKRRLVIGVNISIAVRTWHAELVTKCLEVNGFNQYDVSFCVS